jgi:creatinine amidohydrolase/Fe(II)-dependent formamide hydrolase-like protein
MRSRFMLDLTTPEVDGYLKRGGDLALLPVGSVEMHGPHMPLGTDTIIARAFCLRLAEAADGLVLPDLAYTWAGATDGFAGTISLDPELLQRTVTDISERLVCMGFRRIVIASAHGPNPRVLYTTARTLFEAGMPVLLVDMSAPMSPQADGVFAGDKEASLLVAACEILGIGLYTEKDLSYEDTAPPSSPHHEKLSKLGTIGWFYQDPRQHACPHRNVSREKGLEFIRLQVETLVAGLGSLGAYVAEAKSLGNRGFHPAAMPPAHG